MESQSLEERGNHDKVFQGLSRRAILRRVQEHQGGHVRVGGESPPAHRTKPRWLHEDEELLEWQLLHEERQVVARSDGDAGAARDAAPFCCAGTESRSGALGLGIWPGLWGKGAIPIDFTPPYERWTSRSRHDINIHGDAA